LPEHEQDALARWILAELADQQGWDERLSASGDTLERLADEALAEHRAGQTQVLDPDRL
jgi:hypothetical protein